MRRRNDAIQIGPRLGDMRRMMGQSFNPPQHTPYPRGGYRALPPSSTVSGLTLSYEVAAVSRQNLDHLKHETWKRFHGRVGTDYLLQALDVGIGWYRHRILEPTYGPETAAELCRAVEQINEQALIWLARRFAAQRTVETSYHRELHQPLGSGYYAPVYKSDFDGTIEITRN